MKMLCLSALEGMPGTAMAARGGHRELTDAEITGATDLMVSASAIPAAVLQAAARYESLGIRSRDFIREDANFGPLPVGSGTARRSIARRRTAAFRYRWRRAAFVTVAGVVENADAVRRAYAALKRIKGIKSLRNRLVSSDLLTFD